MLTCVRRPKLSMYCYSVYHSIVSATASYKASDIIKSSRLQVNQERRNRVTRLEEIRGSHRATATINWTHGVIRFHGWQLNKWRLLVHRIMMYAMSDDTVEVELSAFKRADAPVGEQLGRFCFEDHDKV